MNKIGFLCTAYQCFNELQTTLNPFLQFLAVNRDSKISIVHSVFQEFYELGMPILSADNTHEQIKDLTNDGIVDYSYISDVQLSEAAARSKALEPLLNNNLDYIFLVDLSDEYYTVEQLNDIADYIKSDNHSYWWKLSFKNYVFDKKTSLKEPFQPARIWHTNKLPFKLQSFNWDNDAVLRFINNNQLVSDKVLKHKIIPASVASIQHLSWINGERSKFKVKYQEKRFAPTGCSFKSDEDGNLSFNQEYFNKTKQPIPELVYE